MKNLHCIVSLLALTASLSYAHSDAFKPEFVQTLLQPYLHIQTALAKDQLNTAQKSAAEFTAAIKHAPGGENEKSVVEDLTQPAADIENAKDIQSARAAFLNLSKHMELLVSHVGIGEDHALYLAYCPMAFGGKGGAWIQGDKTITNPYYGSQMLRCGVIQKQITGTSSAE